MSLTPGTNILSPVVPFDTEDHNPTHLDIYGKGGFRVVADHAARDAIFSERQTLGMVVLTQNDFLSWRLSTTFTPPGDASKWTAYSTGGDVVGPGSATDNAIVRFDGTSGAIIQNSTILVSDASALVFTTADTSDATTYNICRDDDGAENLHFNVPAGVAGTTGPGHYFSFGGTSSFIVNNLQFYYTSLAQSDGEYLPTATFAMDVKTAVSAAYQFIDYLFVGSEITTVTPYTASDTTSHFVVSANNYSVAPAGSATYEKISTFHVLGPSTIGAGVTVTEGNWNSYFQSGTVCIGDTLQFRDSNTPDPTTFNIRRDDDVFTNLTFTVPAPAVAGEVGSGWKWSSGTFVSAFWDNANFQFYTDAIDSGDWYSQFYFQTGILSDVAIGGVGNNPTVWWEFGANINVVGGGTRSEYQVIYINPPTLTNDDSLVVNRAATLEIWGAPVAGTNTTFKNPYGLWLANGAGLMVEGQLVLGHTDVDLTAEDYTALVTDCILGVTDTGAFGVVLPDPATIDTAHIFIIKDEEGAAAINNIDVSAAGGANIDGELNIPITANYGCLRVYSDGANYFSF